MPTFELSDGGATYHVDAPDETAALNAFHSINGTKSEGSSLGGVAKSLGSGVVEGAIGLASIPGDLMNMAGMKNPMHESMQKAVEGITGPLYKPQGTAEEIASKVGQFLPMMAGGPETLATKALTRVAAPAVASEVGSKIAGPYGELAGALVGAGGATAAARKFQEMAAARKAFPALTADKVLETAGKQFDDARDMNMVVKPDFATNAAADIRDAVKSYDPEVIKGVHGAADRLEGLASSVSKEPVWYQGVWHGHGDKPTSDYWTTTLNKAREYSGPNGHVFAANESSFPERALATRQGDVLTNKEFQPHGPYKVPDIEILGKLPRSAKDSDFASLKSPSPVMMNDAENIRKQLVSLKTSPDASVRSAAKEAIKSLQKSQMGLTSADTVSGDATAYRNLISDAVGNWAKGKQAQTVMGKIGNAELNSATAGSGANQDNNMRQAMKQLARNANNTNLPIWKKLGFSDQAGAAIDQAARGTTLGNIARGVGKGAPTGIVSAAGGLGIGHMAGGPVGAVALPAVGYIAKKIGDLSTKRAANAITSLVLSESPLAAHVASQLPPQIIRQMPARAQRVLQKLVLADPTLSQQASEPVSQP